jgi:hypothetical protein
MAPDRWEDDVTPRRQTQSNGFTYVEVTICLALMTTVVGLVAAAMEGGTQSFTRSSVRGMLTSRVNGALSAIEGDLRETSAGKVATFSDGLDAGYCLMVMPSARDADGAFHLTAGHRPDWQAAVVYCPYTTSGGVRQLRRYVQYDSSYQFPFQSCTINSGIIRLTDAIGQTLQINRGSGIAANDPAFEVFAPGVAGLNVELGDTTTVTVSADSPGRHGEALETEGVRKVAPRN